MIGVTSAVVEPATIKTVEREVIKEGILREGVRIIKKGKCNVGVNERLLAGMKGIEAQDCQAADSEVLSNPHIIR